MHDSKKSWDFKKNIQNLTFNKESKIMIPKYNLKSSYYNDLINRFISPLKNESMQDFINI